MRTERILTFGITLSVVLTLLVGCATTRITQERSVAVGTPVYLNATTGCAVVVGGAIGSQFADTQVAAFWHDANAAITTELYDQLAQAQYKVVKLLIPNEQAHNNERLVVEELARNQCNRLIQVSHLVGEDSGGRYFQFNVLVMRLEPVDRRAGSATNARTVGEFKREYRFARTPTTFDSFHTGTFAQSVFADLRTSGSLVNLVRSDAR